MTGHWTRMDDVRVGDVIEWQGQARTVTSIGDDDRRVVLHLGLTGLRASPHTPVLVVRPQP